MIGLIKVAYEIVPNAINIYLKEEIKGPSLSFFLYSNR